MDLRPYIHQLQRSPGEGVRDFLRKHMIPRPEIEWNVILDVTTGCNLGCPF